MITQYQKYWIGDHYEKLPLLSVRISCNKRHQTVWAIIDSGADMCVFNAEIADLLEIDLETGHSFRLDGFVGTGINAWAHQVNLTVKDLATGQDFASVNTNVAFTDSKQPELSILGQRGFFDYFQIRFQRFKDLIEIWPRSGSL